jgi:hypothetical protein
MKTVKSNSRRKSLEKSYALLPSTLTRQTRGKSGRETEGTLSSNSTQQSAISIKQNLSPQKTGRAQRKVSMNLPISFAIFATVAEKPVSLSADC